MGLLEAKDAPAGLFDFGREITAPPAGWQLDAMPDSDKEEIEKLFFTRTVADPVTNKTFVANEMRDFFRYGWFPTNLQIPIGKKKALGASGWELDAGLLCPIICPDSLYTASDYKEWHPSLNLFIESKSNVGEKEKLPKHLREWHPEDLATLRKKFNEAKPWLQSKAPGPIDAEWNLVKGNRHVREAQRAHHLAALSWQLQLGFEKSRGIVSKELDAWSYVLALEMLATKPGEEVNYKLAQFIANRMEDTVNLENFNEIGYQNYYCRYVFICFWLGEDDVAWDAACSISKLRGGEFTHSPMYEAIIEMRDDPNKIADLFEENPTECLTYFRI